MSLELYTKCPGGQETARRSGPGTYQGVHPILVWVWVYGCVGVWVCVRVHVLYICMWVYMLVCVHKKARGNH